MDLRHNPDLGSLPINAVPSIARRLECLLLDLRPAVRVLDQLPGLSALRSLSLNCGRHDALREEEVLALVDRVGRLPQLRTLQAPGYYGRKTFTMTDAVSEACESLAKQRPCLRFVIDVEGGYRRWARAFCVSDQVPEACAASWVVSGAALVDCR